MYRLFDANLVTKQDIDNMNELMSNGGTIESIYQGIIMIYSGRNEDLDRLSAMPDKVTQIGNIIFTFHEEARSMEIRKYAGLPLYHIEEVIDISYKNQGLPNRVQITGVRMKSTDKEWVYTVMLENTHESAIIDESFLKERACHRDIHDVYKLPVICRRYANGFRFCGNFKESEARKKGKEIKGNRLVDIVRICEAYDGYGKPVSGKVSLWLRYKSPIRDNEPYTPDHIEIYDIDL